MRPWYQHEERGAFLHEPPQTLSGLYGRTCHRITSSSFLHPPLTDHYGHLVSDTIVENMSSRYVNALATLALQRAQQSHLVGTGRAHENTPFVSLDLTPPSTNGILGPLSSPPSRRRIEALRGRLRLEADPPAATATATAIHIPHPVDRHHLPAHFLRIQALAQADSHSPEEDSERQLQTLEGSTVQRCWMSWKAKTMRNCKG